MKDGTHRAKLGVTSRRKEVIGTSGVPRNFSAMGNSLVKQISAMGGYGQPI